LSQTLVSVLDERRTVDHHEEVNPENSKSLANSVICVLELALHDSSINLDDDDAAKTGEYHPVSLENIDFGGQGLPTFDDPIDQSGISW
jgi:hypothetical protein